MDTCASRGKTVTSTPATLSPPRPLRPHNSDHSDLATPTTPSQNQRQDRGKSSQTEPIQAPYTLLPIHTSLHHPGYTPLSSRTAGVPSMATGECRSSNGDKYTLWARRRGVFSHGSEGGVSSRRGVTGSGLVYVCWNGRA